MHTDIDCANEEIEMLKAELEQIKANIDKVVANLVHQFFYKNNIFVIIKWEKV